MESFKWNIGLRAMAVVLIFAAVMVPEATAVRYIVGDRMGWNPRVDWAQNYHFYEGDWLFFLYNKDQMDVLEVNRADYETCNANKPLRNWTSGTGRDVVPLNVMNKMEYYFITSKDFCKNGTKVAIFIDPNPPPPPPSLSDPPSSSLSNPPPPSLSDPPPPSLSDATGRQVSTFGLVPALFAVAVAVYMGCIP